MRICLIGGSPAHRGGLEAFCDRVVAAAAPAPGSVEIRGFPTRTAYGPLRSLLRLPQAFQAMRRAARHCDLAWVQVSNFPDTMFIPLARLAGMPVLATPHFGANSPLQTKAWRRWFCRYALSWADRLALLFEEQAAEIDLPSRVPSDTLGTFLPSEAFRPAQPGGPNTPLQLIHAARFSADKGTFRMLALCASLKRGGIPFRARLVGRGDAATMARIKQMMADEALGDDVELIDWLDAAAMQRALREADVLVHLSVIDSFPLIVLEALAAGTLPVVFPMAGVKAMIEGLDGLIVAAQRPVASAFELLAKEPLGHLRERGEHAGRATRTAYAWPVMLERLRKIATPLLAEQD